MKKNAPMLRASLLFATLVLASCGVTTTGGGTTSNTGNTSPPTTTNGPVTISTDHSRYAPTDLVSVTVVNTTGGPIYAYDHQASCSVLALEVADGTNWKPAYQLQPNLAGCAMGRMTVLVTIAAGQTLQANIMAGYLRRADGAFPVGTYRLVLRYLTARPATPASAPPFTEAISGTFVVATDVPPQPLPTVASNTQGAGSATVQPLQTQGTGQP